MPEYGRTELPVSGRRFAAFAIAIAFSLVVLTGRLIQLQIVDGAQYRLRSESMSRLEVPVPSARGLIFDRNGLPLAINVARWDVVVVPARLPKTDRATVLARVAALTGEKTDTLLQRVQAYRGASTDRVVLVSGVSRATALLLGAETERLKGIEVVADSQRQYLGANGQPDGSLLSAVLGYTAPISAAELARLGSDGYLADDQIGRTGVEASFESELRGVYGANLIERTTTGGDDLVLADLRPAVAGRNLALTIDARLQEMATRALRWGLDAGRLTSGVTIVMNPQTGEILAMVSLPTYDNNAFATGIDPALYQSYLADPARPLRNHAISDVYPPGSTFKLVTGLAALEEGVTTPSRLWPTYGCYPIPGATDGTCLYDWNRRGFGPLDLVDAFAFSSDTFFYQMAVQLGIDRLATWAGNLGFGRPTGIRLPNEASGTVASTAWARSQGRNAVYTGEIAQAGIGQNVISVTPLQLLNAYAAVANGGQLMRPMIVGGYADDFGALVEAIPPEVMSTVGADTANMRIMRIGAREVITTGHALNIRRLNVPGALSGKTGTAEYGTPGPDGALPYHSWFVAFVPSSPGADDASLAVITFTYRAMALGNVSTEVVKYFLQEYFALDQDLRLDPFTLHRVAPDNQ